MVRIAVRGHDQSDEEQVDDVEDEDTQGNLLRGSWDLLLGVLGLSGSQADQLGSSVGEGGGDEDSTEAMEAVEELRAQDPLNSDEWQGWQLEIVDASGQAVQVIPLDALSAH